MMAISAVAMTDHGDSGLLPSEARWEAYTPLPPFRINNNLEFAAAALANGWPGAGTAADPYVIAGYDVSALGESAAVYIANTTVHFLLSSCWIHGVATNGLALVSVSNATVISNTLSGVHAGAFMRFSKSITLANNTFVDCPETGLEMSICRSLNISNNSFSRSETGIYAFICSSDLLALNSFDNCTVSAIDLEDSTSMTLTGNSMSGCGIELASQTRNAWTSHLIDGSNLVNGLPVYYAANQDGGSAPAGAGQVILGGCSNMTVMGLPLNDTSIGVLVGFSSNVTVADCSFSGDGSGVRLASSDHVLVTNNTFTGNGYGLALWDTRSFRVDNNSVLDSTSAGIDIVRSIDGVFRNNTQVNCGFLMDGALVNMWTTHDIDQGNTVNGRPVFYASGLDLAFIPASGLGQVILANCTGTTISGANISRATVPVMLGFCSACTIDSGNFSNSYAGVMLIRSDGTLVTGSSAWDNDFGVFLSVSVDTTLSGDVIGDNPEAGVYALQSSRLTMIGNDMHRCGMWLEGFVLEDFGSHSIGPDNLVNGRPLYYITDQTGGTVPGDAGEVILANCSHMLVENQNVSGSTIGVHINFSDNITTANITSDGNLDGLEMLRCYDSSVRNCTFRGDVYGIVADASSRNWFTDNLVSDGTSWGIYLSSRTSDNLVWNNTIVHNRGSRDSYDPARIQAFDGGTTNVWNSATGGNYWADWTAPDANGDGIVDLPYICDGSMAGRDLMPLTESTHVIPEFGRGALLVIASCVLCVVLVNIRRKKPAT